MGLLDGKVAFVTGAGRGIGRAIVEAFTAEGAIIAAAARTTKEITALCADINASGGRAVPITMDIRSEESIKEAISKAQSELGPIDVLVNNAAIIALGKIHEMATQTWDDVMSTNVRGVFLTCREVLPQMMERRTGRIINVGSTAGRRGYDEQGAYCASKHALAGLSKVLAIETKKYGIRVQMLSPGGVLTGLSSDLRASRGEAEDSPDWMTTEEIARAAVYLCSQDGAAFTDELVLRRYASEPWR
ncbi:MAG: SDR family oxidoreductase [Armatimonadota bacterium]|nr:SDR family oxidoreductase [bacterium]